jgi:uncharacterized membrane protein
VRVLGLVLVISVALWVMLLVGSPLAIASSHRTPFVLAATTYSIGSLVCHQQQNRSFVIAGRQMPVCARCTGLYASALVGGLIAIGARRQRVSDRARWVLAALAVPTIISWSTDYVGLTHTANVTRALLAAPLGIAAGWIVIGLLGESRS